MSKTTFSSKSTNLTTATTAATTTTTTTRTNTGGSTNPQSTNQAQHTEIKNITRYRESPSWIEPYYVHERVKDREDHRRRIREVIKGVEGAF
ncbi:hypothetical protein BDV29DRAFT_176194 [Aspergillus leporis]|uniref:Uncharacterized protein n=1 Tax=Aspergillus leporis TaxID=41062 RepID=A0A5N5WWX3_9EURO|nr:hypothetical protein BDV29DRAFT_176194 [Aspergillus leporis]